MLLNDKMKSILIKIMTPYLSTEMAYKRDLFIIKDLGISGSDYIDLVEELEKSFQVDLQHFLQGEKPAYTFSGFFNKIFNQKIPILRDFSIGDLEDFLAVNQVDYGIDRR